MAPNDEPSGLQYSDIDDLWERLAASHSTLMSRPIAHDSALSCLEPTSRWASKHDWKRLPEKKSITSSNATQQIRDMIKDPARHDIMNYFIIADRHVNLSYWLGSIFTFSLETSTLLKQIHLFDSMALKLMLLILILVTNK